MQPRAQRITRAHERAALAFLAKSPYDNVFLSWVIAADRSLAARSSLYVFSGEGGAVRGVAFFGRHVVLAAEDDAAIEAFADISSAYRFERMIVGPRSVVERYWERVRKWHTPPRRIRESQPVLAVDRSTLRAGPGGVHVRRAYAHEWETVALNSAKMIQHELEYDPRGASAEFNANVRIMIDRGMWWVGEHDGELCFFCNAGPYSEHTLQLQGIWAPEHLRGRGLASRALAGICDELLRDAPTLSLYVNGFNESALKLYDRVGFRRTGELTTLLF
jgi:RimJ/RimL family protein N-acetyltransferase